MSELEKKILDRIRREGPIPFEQYMGMALYEPNLGYYTKPSADIGSTADFYTSTNVHALFGAILARQVEEIWRLLDRPDPFWMIEQGPGRGLFALDFLGAARQDLPEFYGRLRYALVELDGGLRERQKKLLTAHGDRVLWVDHLRDLHGVEGVLFSNELVDAFPVHLMEFTEEGWREIYVKEADGTLRETLGSPSSDLLAGYFRQEVGDRWPGYRTELNLNARQWLREAGRVLGRGFLITVDYGFSAADYYSPERSTGTLLCYHRHQTHERPLEQPGEQDITSHVNFSALVQWGIEAGLEPLGFTSQSSFLLNLGIDGDIARLHESLPEKDYLETVARIRTLLMPDGMGESHKVLIQEINAPRTSLTGLKARNILPSLIAGN